MKTRTVVSSLLVLVLAAGTLVGCKGDKKGAASGSSGDTVWIKVNGKPIMKSQVEEEMNRFRQQLSTQMPEEQLAGMENMIKHDAMQRAVQAAVLEQNADAEGITIDDAKVQEELKKLKSQFPDDAAFQQRLKDLNLAEADLLAELKKSLRFQQLLERKVPVNDPTEEEIASVYERAKERLLEPAKATVISVFISVPTTATEDEKKKRKELAGSVLKKAQAGEDLKALAQQFSEASSKAEGGRETITKGSQVPELDAAVFALKPGELSGVIETPQGFYIIKLEELTPEKTPTIDDVRAEIVQFLREGQQREKMQSYVEELVKAAQVEYIEPLPDMSAMGGGMGMPGMPPQGEGGHGPGDGHDHGETPPEGASPSGELPPGQPPTGGEPTAAPAPAAPAPATPVPATGAPETP